MSKPHSPHTYRPDSPPPCGEGSGVGVHRAERQRRGSPHPVPPRKGEGTLWPAPHSISIARLFAGVISLALLSAPALAAEIKVLTAGRMRGVVDALVPGFEKQTGHKVSVDNATAGVLAERIEGGEAFDVAIITPKVLADLAQKGKIAAALASTSPRSVSAWP